jgi:acylphosphatase
MSRRGTARGPGRGPRPGDDSEAVRVRITGIVHGVVFRASMAREASYWGVRGWVRNVADGSVEAHLEGDPAMVRRIVEWAKRGPPRARVDSISVLRTEPRGIRGFRITG